MAWSYGGNPVPGSLDEIRFLIGDTDSTNQLIQDGEVKYVMAQTSSSQECAAQCCEAVAAKLTGKADMSIGNVRVSFSQQAKSYMTLAVQLRAKVSLMIMPYAGGMSQGEKDAAASNTDAVKSIFSRGMMRGVNVDSSSNNSY